MKKLINKIVELWNYAKTRNKIMSMRIDEVVDMKAKALVVDKFDVIVAHIFSDTWNDAIESGSATMRHSIIKGMMDKQLQTTLDKYGVGASKRVTNY